MLLAQAAIYMVLGLRWAAAREAKQRDSVMSCLCVKSSRHAGGGEGGQKLRESVRLGRGSRRGGGGGGGVSKNDSSFGRRRRACESKILEINFEIEFLLQKTLLNSW